MIARGMSSSATIATSHGCTTQYIAAMMEAETENVMVRLSKDLTLIYSAVLSDTKENRILQQRLRAAKLHSNPIAPITTDELTSVMVNPVQANSNDIRISCLWLMQDSKNSDTTMPKIPPA